MKSILTVATALITGLFLNSSAIAEDAKPAEWLFAKMLLELFTKAH